MKFNNSIIYYKNRFKSKYCKSPCGLTNIFSYKNSVGCFDTLKVKKNEILNLKNFNSLQRGSLKENYINFINNPVGCQKNINLEILYKHIIEKLEN